MTLLKVNWLCLLMLICLISNGQSNNNEKQFGFEIGSIVPINYFGAGPLNLKDEHSTIILSSKIGYHFGMVMKTNYGEKFSFESGINFLRRNFKLIGSSNFNGIPMNDTSDFGYISYGLPFKGMVYIQLSKGMFLNTSVGTSLDFYASTVMSNGTYTQNLSERARWINGSVLADLGVEWRNDINGVFFFGAGVNIPISSIAVTKLKFFYDSSTNPDRYEEVFLRGNFFNVKIKYYLPSGL